MSALPYRPCVGIMLLNANNKVFIGKRKGGPEQGDNGLSWQMPQGGIDEGEDPYACARRELFEETNITSVELIAEHEGWLNYELPDALIGKAWKGKYRGQTQKWFLLRFTGNESEINVSAPAGGASKAEFCDWAWTEASKLPALIVPFKRAIYEKLSTWPAHHTAKAS